MAQWRDILTLAFKDYSHEWRLSGCFILGLAAVLGPLLILFGLRFGIVNTMVSALIQDPRNREIQPLGSGRYGPEWFKRMRARKEVAFVIPRTRTLAAMIELRSETSARIIPAELIPSGAGDPLLDQVAHKPQGLNQVVLAETAARKLNVTPGAVIEGHLMRQYRGKRERVQIKLTVAGITHTAAFSRAGVFASLDLVIAAENFRDGRAVPALGWEGDAPTGQDRSFPSYRLYTRSIYDVAPLEKLLTREGQTVKTNEAEIKTVQALNHNLSRVFWIITLAGMSGFSLSLGASLWANVDRKRRELSMLRLIGINSRGIILFPTFQALLTGVFGWLAAVLIYLAVERIINRLFGAQLFEVKQTLCYLLPEHFLGALALTLLSVLFAAALGGFRAARIQPAEGLREL